jgi:hypothetical protein
VTPQSPVFAIPVWFHVIKSDAGAGGMAIAKIQSQVLALNQDFNAIPHGIPSYPSRATAPMHASNSFWSA